MKFGIFSEIQVPKPLGKDDWDPGQEARIMNEAIDQIVHADRLGFNYIFQVEHHFAHEYSHSSAPEVILGALAGRTKNIRIASGITHMLPKVNHPARVAERVATLDVISNGRFEFGTGSGATPNEISPFGVSIAEKRAMWRESTEECLKMMAMQLYPGYDGTHFSMPERELIPKPVQKPHPPVWLACGRRDNMRDAGKLGMGALGLYFESPEIMGEVVAEYWDAVHSCEQPIGLAMNPAMVATSNMMCCRTRDEALEKGGNGADFFSYAIGRYGQQPLNNLWQGFATRSEEEKARIKAEAEGPSEELLSIMALENDPENFANLVEANLRKGLTADTFMDSPEALREKLRAYEEANIDAIIFLIQCGDRKHEDILGSLELFAKEVMPEFQERHENQQRWRSKQLEKLRFPINSSI